MVGLTLNAQATYSDAHYTRFCETITSGTPGNGDPLCSVNGLPGADRRGNALNEEPKWSGGVGADYEVADRKSVAEGKIVSVRVDIGGRCIGKNKKQSSKDIYAIK